MSNSRHIPTLGFPTQKDAIIALYEDRVEPRVIADKTGAPINSVHRALREYRADTGRIIAPIRTLPHAKSLPREPWHDDEQRRRIAAHKRAVMGARKTLEAAQ